MGGRVGMFELLRENRVLAVVREVEHGAEVENLENSRAAIPIGALSGADLLSGSGFDIDVSFHSIQNVSTKIESSFDECGINQTKHSLKLLISTNVSAVMPGKDMTVTVDQEFLLSETVIVGKIPDVYLKKI
jgi:sporulation protein YunB